MTLAAARSAYGHGTRLAPFHEPGNAPSSLSDVDACFVWSKGAVVATVRRYSKRSGVELATIYDQTKPRPRRVGLKGLGPGAVLYDVWARPGNYEEDILFSAGRAVVTVRSRVLAFARPPRAPLPRLATLARAIRTNLVRA